MPAFLFSKNRKRKQKSLKKSQKKLFYERKTAKSRKRSALQKSGEKAAFVKNRQKKKRQKKPVDIFYNAEYNDFKKFILMKNNSLK